MPPNPPKTPDNKRKRGTFSSGKAGDASTPRKKQKDLYATSQVSLEVIGEILRLGRREWVTRKTKPGNASTSTVPKQETNDDLDAQDLYSTTPRLASHKEVIPDEEDLPKIIFTRSQGREEFKCEVEQPTTTAVKRAQEVLKLEELQSQIDSPADDSLVALTTEELQVPKPPCTCKPSRQQQSVTLYTVNDEPNTNGNRGKKYYRCNHWCSDHFINFFDDWELVVEWKLGSDWRKLPAAEIPEWLPCRGRVKMGTTDDWRFGRRNYFKRNVEEGGKLVVKDLVDCEWKVCECVGGDCPFSESK